VTGRHLEDFTPGDEFVTLGRTLTEESIIGFAAQWQRSAYGGLIASGFHTLAVGFRLFIDTGVVAGTSIGSPGIDQLRWLLPVRPGDTLHTIVRVLETRPSASKPDRGIVRLAVRILNQRDEAVLTLETSMFITRRTV
jgi:acyl dehydratase